jgi:hypothetical protein
MNLAKSVKSEDEFGEYFINIIDHRVMAAEGRCCNPSCNRLAFNALNLG